MDSYQSNQSCYCMRCRGRGLMGPAVLVTLGLLFLLNEFGVAYFHSTWPVVLIVIGLVKVLAGNLDTTGHVEGVPPAGTAPLAPQIPPPQNPESREADHV